jgi:hypothetical protein
MSSVPALDQVFFERVGEAPALHNVPRKKRIQHEQRQATALLQRPRGDHAGPGSRLRGGVVVYLLNGQDYVRAAIAAVLCGLIGWYSGKAFFPRVAAPTTESVN